MPGPLDDAAARRGAADRLDRGLVGGEIGLGIARGHRRFAEHVVRVAKALGLARPGVGERLLDRLAGDELLAHQAHRHVDAAADQRLAAAADDAPERRAEADVAVRRHQPAGEQQPPGGGVDEQRRALAEVRAPVAARDLVADQRVAGGGIGNAQQRFGQAHQRHALARAERELLQQALHQAGPAGFARALAHAAGDAQGELVRGAVVGRGEARLLEQRRQQFRLGRPRRRGDRRAQRRAEKRRGQQGLCYQSGWGVSPMRANQSFSADSWPPPSAL